METGGQQTIMNVSDKFSRLQTKITKLVWNYMWNSSTMHAYIVIVLN